MKRKNNNNTMMKRFSRKAFFTLALLTSGASGVMAQSVIMNGDYFLTHNEAGTTVNTAATTTFNPATCLWVYAQGNYIRTADGNGDAINNNNNYLQYTSLTLGTDGFNWYSANNNANVYHRTGNYYNRTYYYLRLNGTTWQINNTDSNNGVLYNVTVTDQGTISTDPTINGLDVITATSNTTYTATGAAYRAGYTNYYFRNANHYVDENGNSFTGTPANATLTNAWSLESNSYATVNNSGVVTISSLPASDITLTLTVTATATGGTPAAPAGTTLTGTKEITIQGTKPSAPTISVNGNSVELDTDATGTTTIRYTLDGSDPTATTGAVYSGAIDLSTNGNSPVTIKAVTVRNGNASAVSTEVVTLTLPEPTITVNGSAGTATISSSVAGATIYYTTDGSTPTTSSSQYTGSLSGLAAMTTIKAITVKDGWNNSPEASDILTIPSGVSGGTVTLFDYEDHTWTYYSGVDASVDGGNYNTDYEGKLYSPDPRNVKITYKANGGAVSIDESETEFVYYKTIEKVNGAYNYTVISNPFSKRPNGKGFGGWKIKEGAQYINGYADEATLPLDAELTLTGLDTNYTPNCTSAEIELEATWVNYNNLTYANGNTITYSVTGGTYETNFLVLNRNVTGTITVSSPCTIMMVEPDGSTDYRGTYTFSGNITPNNNGVTKIEFTRWNSQNTVNAGYRNLWIGRGMTTTSRCANLITGYNGTGSVASPQYSIKVESGIYQYFDFYKGHSTYTGGTANTGFTVSGSDANAKITMGNDYDRAKGANSTLEFIYGPMLGYSGNFSSTNNRDNAHTLDLTVKSGTIGSTFFMENTNTATYLQGGAGYCMYLSSAGSQTNVGTRNVLIEGGDICSIGGGIDSYNNGDSGNTDYKRLSFNLRIKGGTIHGNVYGGAAKSPAGGNRVMVMTGGQVKGWFAAGCNGTDNDGGQTYGTSYVYIGGNGSVDSEGSTKVLGYANGGNVYAAGAGRQGATTCGEMTFGTNLVIADDSYIERGIYGGGNYGYALAETNIYITGGTNEGNDGTVNGVTTNGGVYGGANQQDGPGIKMYMTGGTMKGGVYGGCNTRGTISGSVTMNINGGQVGTDSKTANIHGGGYGSNTVVSQNVDITLGTTAQTTQGVTVYGDVYGGSALGDVNGTAATNTYHTNVTMNKGTINGSLYGGGLGDASTAANVYGPVAVKVYGGTVNTTSVSGSGAVYGCNNINGAPQGTVNVDIYGTDPAPSADTYALDAVYGGGNKANYAAGTPVVKVHNCDNSIGYVYGGGNAAHITNGDTDVTIYGGNKIGNVFGGGNGQVEAANVSGDTNVKIYGGTIGKVFGGSNTQGNIGGSINVTIVKQDGDTDPDGTATACAMHIDEVYGGGNKAASNAGNISIGCTGGQGEGIGDVYGGANQANITGDISLEITGGSIERVFGGNNIEGSITGGIQVDVNWDTANPCGYNHLGNVFGGGNLAQYTIPSGKTLAVNILNGTVSENVYGGGKGDASDHTKGQVTGNPTVTIGDASRLNDNNVKAEVTGDVYGGGDAGNVVGTPVVNVINKCNTTIGNVYGGGNAADVDGTDVNIDGGVITGMVFGGGHGDKNSTPQKQADVNGDVSVEVTGGTIGKVFGGSNSKGTISGTVAVNIEKGATSCDMHITEVYGGGNEAAGNAGTLTIGCTGDYTNNQEGIGDVYGGANAADINNNISLVIRGGHIDNVYGGNNASGTISGTIAVNVNWDNSLTCDKYLGNVFGGGNRAVYAGSPTVTLTNGTVSHSVYGGGNEAGVGGSEVNINGGSVVDGVYGGCNTSGDVTGNIVVNINGGTLGTSSAPLTSGIFGGGFGKNTTTAGNVTVNVGDANAASAAATSTIYGDIYGGSALGTVNDAVADVTTVNINNGTIHGNIYGGGLGSATLNSNGYIDDTQPKTEAIVNGTVHVNIGTSTQASNFVTIDGQVFGCNNLAGTPKGHVYVDVYHTAHTSANTTPTPPATAADVASLPSTAFAIAAVYGGGNLAHYTTTETGASTHVHIHNCDNTIEYVYGGGNAASSPKTDVVIDGGRFNYIFGGGNGAGTGNPGADIEGDAKATINGGVIYRAFGGSNTKGNIGGTSSVELPDATICDPRLVHELFGGGNEAPGGNVDMVIPCGTTGTGIVYAGANKADMGTQADFEAGRPVLIKLTVEGGDFTQVFGGNNESGTIWGDVELHLKGGTIANAFGGNNLGGDIKGTIKVFVEEDGSCPLVLTNVYGGGYNAAYTPVDPTIESPLVFVNHVKSGNQVLGNVFGGGYGTPATVTANPVVTIGNKATGHESEIATIAGNVYGGGEQASVVGSTKVIMQKDNSVVKGTIYGAGKGLEDNPAAALVTGNTLVTMTSGQVQRSIYGGGELSSVGTFTETYGATSGSDTDADYHVKGEPKTCADNTGLTEVLISGGQVGLVNQLMPDPANPTSDDDYGYVFCAGKGMADPTQKNSDGVPYANLLAVSDSSHLVISGNALIAASVYGGSENGQVLGNTFVEIKGGQIGSGHYKEGGVDKWDAAYTEAQWTQAIAAVKSLDESQVNTIAAQFHECDAWPFGPEGSRHVYDYFHGTSGYDSKGGGNPGSDGHSYYGHVFGGGSGYYPYAAGKWRRTAGRVNGNTLVEITGGHILTNVYGGNEITDVLGSSKVVMTAGTVGIPRTKAGIQARPVNCYIFGAGMGDPRVLFNGWSNVGSAEVVVDSVAVVFGSVFGGGEDGHVLGDVSTTVKGGALIGTLGSSGVDGNIFGSGRGFSALALTAGAVCGNVTVNVADSARILGSIFGGGRMAAVGTHLVLETDAERYGVLIPDGKEQVLGGNDVDAAGKTHGHVTVNISGGTIGNLSQMATSQYSIGDVFGGSKGTLMDDWAKSQKLGLVKSTEVNISQATGYTTTIYGNVYGGGELASVGSYDYATDTQASAYSTAHPNEPMAEGDVYALKASETSTKNGLAKILITGGTIGQATPSDTKGHVFGGCLGRAGTDYSGYSFVNNSDVTLQGGTVYGSIFGGGENGHVMHDTDVKIKSGTVGIPLDKASLPDASLNDSIVYKGNVYGGGRGIDTYNNNGTDTYSITAGKVGGNTNVTVEGGTVYRSVYGGGSLASVGIRDEDTTTDGLATVIIKGGQIGTDGGASANNYLTNIPDRDNRRENGFVFGSGRGMSAGANSSSNLVDLAYTKNTLVSIEGTANVTGSVFGGGENGHVKHNTRVNVKENCLIGTELIDDEHTIDDNGRGRLIYRGNVYGGGRGIDEGGDNKLSLTAGRVYGDTYVEVSGGKIYHDVFGGGSLASVGNETVNATNGEVTYGDNSGVAEVHIKGGIIGYSSTAAKQGFNCGFVYGGCRGLSANPSSEIIKMAYVHETKVYIEPGADVKGSVFGGGANGHVKNDTYVSISGGSVGTALTAAEATLDDHGVAPYSIFRGNVYTGGRGVDMFQVQQQGTTAEKYSLSAGAVYGNATLEMTGGHVWHNIYGSGAMASVGTVEAKPAGTHVHDEIVDGNGNLIDNTQYNPDESEINYLTGVFKANTGKVTLTITGGTVGDTTTGHEGINNGNVFGAGRGVSASRSDYVASMEFVNETEVIIGTSGQTSYTGNDPKELNYPFIYGNVYGGGENGHVKTDTDVKIYSGIIGWPLVEGTNGKYRTEADGSTKNPYRGHVFGGGCGVDPLYHGSTEERSSTAGRVYGHTNVTMEGGVVRRAIYGGGLLASVGVYRLLNTNMHIIDKIEDNENPIIAGDAKITVSGGYVGNVDTNGYALGTGYLLPGDNNGHVFGSSCGMVADDYVVGTDSVDVQYRQMGYTHSTHVNISGDDTRIYGCVFGSGENGHVWEDAVINISGGQIGSQAIYTNTYADSTAIYMGNVYGSGRGVDHPHAHISETAGKVRGNTTVNITGGTVWRDVYGGGSLASVGEATETADDSKKNVSTDDTVNNPFPYATGLTRVIIDSLSVVHGSIYGSGRGVASSNTEYKQAAYVKNTLVTVKGNAHVWQNVFGGGNAGHVRKNTDVTIDGQAKVDGNVYGGGAGSIESPTAGLVNHDVVVNIKNGLIAGDVYGGGAIANTNVHDVRNDASTNHDQASAYGSTCLEPTRQHCTTAVNLVGGIILGNAYGGGQGVIPADGATAAEIANSGAMVRGDVTVTLNGTGFMLTKDQDDQGNDIATTGRVFGCNNLNGSPQGTVLVHVLQTKGVTKSGDTYTFNATKPTLDTDTYEVEAVYGGGNLAAYQPWKSDEQATGQFTTYTRNIEGTATNVTHSAVKQPLQVVIEGCDETSINYVYGGGNAASAPSTDVLVIGCYEIGNVFGGGNGKDRISKNNVWSENPGANVGFLDGNGSYGTGEALASVVGGNVHYAFGGSNTKGNIRTSAKVFLDEASDCPLKIGEVYGGGNEAYMEGDSKVELGCITELGVLYGGARNANIDGDIEMNISSGHFGRIFGGNNIGGTINGSITVTIEETGCNPITIGELYGCGNNAEYKTPSGKPDPSVNLKSFTSIGRVFGGGYGSGAIVTGNTTVNINEVVGDKATVASPYPGTTITLNDGTTVDLPAHESGKIGSIGTVFGGGNAAQVNGNTNVNIGTLQTIDYKTTATGESTPRTNIPVVGVDIRGNVFGGGNQAEVSGNTNVIIGR